MSFSLRGYQQDAVDQIRGKYQRGVKKVLLYGMTGFGKSEVFCYVAIEMAKRGKYCFVVTRGRELVYNAHARLQKRGVDCGILMAGNEFIPGKFVYVISIDTLNRRAGVIEHVPDLIVVDEAHFAGAPTFKRLAEIYPMAFYLGVTATPWQKDSIEHIASEWVAPVTYDQLVSQGFLVPSKTYAPIQHDLKGVKVRAGDYDESQLWDVMDKRHVYGNIVDHYVKVTNKAKAICFCINVQHSKNMMEVFNAQGIRAAHLDASSSDEVRKDVISALTSGALDVVTNCNILSTGIDIPSLRSVISAAPTKSRIRWVQCAGRGSRPHRDKEFFYLMDHANNVKEHGFIEEFIPPMLSGRPKFKKIGVTPTKTCKSCLAVVLNTAKICPYCDTKFETERELETKKLTEMEEAIRYTYDTYSELIHMSLNEKEFMEKLTKTAYNGHYKRSYLYIKSREIYGEWRAKKLCAREIIDHYTTQIELAWERSGLEKPRGFRKNNPWQRR